MKPPETTPGIATNWGTRQSRALSASEKTVLALVATWVAGFVDATGWLLLSHIYTSNMTGNTIGMSTHVVDGRWSGILQRGWPVAMFVCGLVVAAVATEFFVRRGVKSFSALNLGVAAALIACFIPLAQPVFRNGEIHARSPWEFNLLVALLAIAMGIQNQTVSHIGSLSFRTTHVTGTLTTFAAKLSEYCFWAYDRLRSGRRGTRHFLADSTRRPEFRAMTFNFGLWAAFVVGAVAAVFARSRAGVLGLVAPAGLLSLLALIDVARPIAASAEVEHIRQERLDVTRDERAA